MRLALECRRRVKEQQKRVGAAEFRNTHFSYSLGVEGVERFVTTPELQSEDQIGTDPLPPGQVWAISPGGVDDTTGPGLYRIDANEGPGSGVRILNRPAPAAFSESVRYAEQNLYARSRELVGDHDPRAREFNIQLRAFGVAREGSALGLPALLALCGALLGKSLKGGLVAVGGLNSRWRARPALQRRQHRRAGRREGRGDPAPPRLGPPPAQRPLRRHGDEDQRPLLRRRARRAPEGARRLGTH